MKNSITLELEENAYYHIFNRGINKTDLFTSPDTYKTFLIKYSYYCYPSVDTYSFCLLKNHFHLLIRIRSSEERDGIISSASGESDPFLNLDSKPEYFLLKKGQNTDTQPYRLFSHFFNSYAQYFNKREIRTGSLFSRPFKRIQIDSDQYFHRLVCYIHQNPQLHGLVKNFRVYPYSSFRIFFSNINTHLNKKETLEHFGGLTNFKQAHEDIIADKNLNYVIES